MQLPKHRLEALTDGIYAVAMTLLVIDLRVPERHAMVVPAAGNAAFMLMAVVNATSRRFERQPA